MFVPEQEKQEEGLYNLYFHACPNYQRDLFPLNFQVSIRAPTTKENFSYFLRLSQVDIVEENDGNYLSAGEIPLPSFYFMMSLIFFLSGLFWVFMLKKST